jgi:hypothetical protein
MALTCKLLEDDAYNLMSLKKKESEKIEEEKNIEDEQKKLVKEYKKTVIA